MAALKFTETHNLVAFLSKLEESDGFEQIIDFLNENPINYALTINPTIYTSCIKQFWATAKAKTVNGEVQIQALVDGKKVIVTEASVRRDLQLVDENGTECLPNATIFAELERNSVPTHSNDLLLSGEDRLKLNELMELCTSLSQRVLDLEKTKTAQAKEIASLKKYAQVVSSEDEGLGDQEDASKQGRKIDEINQDAEVTLVMRRKGVTTAGEVVTTANVDELTLAQTLIEIKGAKPKARGVIVQEPSEFTTTTSLSQPSQLPQAKDKGKAKMVEPEKHLKKKDQIMFDKEMLFDKKMKRLNTFVDMDTELVKGSKTRTKGSSKRAREELESENLKKQKLDENVEAEVDDDQEEVEMKKGRMGYFQIIRADGSSKRYSLMIQMLQNIDREDLETLWKLVKAKNGLTRPEDGYESVLWGDLKMMFEPDIESAAKNHFMKLNELMELKDGAYENTRIYKERTKRWHDSRFQGDKNFKVGDKVLLFNSRFKMHPGKLKSKWYGPNVVKNVYQYGTVEIIDKNRISFKVNGQRLKKYHDGHIDAEEKEVVELNEATT
ncbi:hypothetical protein Tco_0729101 [Tanacetum coccineum]|uniref:Uncharacterized protein n=1 Tax=Tanacetum coccineum TaxID=301880 RepID=A0ABQ4YNW2_9ASTR